MTKKYQLAHETLTSLLDYDPATGVFTWKVSRSNRVKPGSRAGVLHQASGGRYISIGTEKIRAHRLAFFYVNKRWPNSDVRPLDGDYDNCAIANLQEVSRVELQHSRAGAVSTNTSGYAGVSRAKYGKWQAKITWNYKQVNLGASFDTAEDASEMYEEAARRLKEGVATEDDRQRVLGELNLWRRQQTAWKHMLRMYAEHGWASFDEFCATVGEIPDRRFAMVPADATQKIGPQNFRWATPIDAQHKTTTAAGRAAYVRERNTLNRDHERHKHIMKNYRISLAEEQRLRAAQSNACLICDAVFGDEAPAVDHDHDTGKVRGLLCKQCNYAVGQFGDNPRLLHRAAEYLEARGKATPLSMDRGAWAAEQFNAWLTEPLGLGVN